MHPGKEGMIFSKLFGMGNKTNKLESGEVSRKEKSILYFSKGGLKLKIVSALKRSFWFALNLFIALLPTCSESC